VAVLALGLGLGLSTTMFGVLDAVLHPRPDVAEAQRLFWINPRMSVAAGKMVTQEELRRLIQDQTRSFDAVLPVGGEPLPIQIGSEEQMVRVARVPSRWFDAVGARLAAGRAFTPTDGEDVMVAGYGAWLRAGRPKLGNWHLLIGDRPYAGLGVLAPEAWKWGAVLPMSAAQEATQEPGAAMATLVRLRPEVRRDEAQADLNALAGVLTARYGAPGFAWALNLISFGERREEVADVQVAMVGAALIVLLIACVNLAHLMLARGLAKRRELAIRMALGAARRAVVRLMFAEALLAAAGGVVLGAVLAVWGARVLRSLVPREVNWVGGTVVTQLSWRVFTVGVLAAAGSAVLFGLLPAIRVGFRIQLTAPLKDEAGTTTGASRGRFSGLVITEVALALALMMAGALWLRVLHQVRHTPLGFDAETLAEASVYASTGHAWPQYGKPESAVTLDWAEVLASARRTPEALGAALAFQATPAGMAVTAETGEDSVRMITMPDYTVVSPEYLHVHGLPILRGRDFQPGDAAGDGVAILSAAAEARLYPRRDAVGRMLKLGGLRNRAPWVRIVGVARTPLSPSHIARPGQTAPIVWISRPAAGWAYGQVLVRTRGSDPGALIALRRALAAVPGVRFAVVQPFTWQRDAELATIGFFVKVFAAMGAAGLALAAFGVYGVLAYAVARRMREFAVRIALGAEPGVVFRMVMHDGLAMLLAGTGIGAFVALAAAYLLNDVLIGVYPTDAISLVTAESMLLAVGLAATLAPARRAVRANPLDILRAV
jgi:putative ABC transport system permease protein